MKRLLLMLAIVALPQALRAEDTTGTGQHLRSVVASLDGHAFTVQLATNEHAREQGLMFRKHLPADRGMLFAFPHSSERSFWMKNTLVPLDIVFFDKHFALVSMQLDVPPCTSTPCPVYPSGAPARYVLELPGGTMAAMGANVGDALKVEGDIGPVH